MKIKNQKYKYLLYSLSTLIFFIYSFTLNETYPIKLENKNLTFAQVKIIDKQKKPKFGDIIEVIIFRQPLFGVRESHKIYKTTTDKNGIAKKFNFPSQIIIHYL